jgi:hypothetical protein
VCLLFHARSDRSGGRQGTMSLPGRAPTALSLLGIGSARRGRRSRSWCPHDEGHAPANGAASSCCTSIFERSLSRLRTDEEKLILGRGPYRKQLFGLTADPAERVNLLEREPPVSFRTLAGHLATEHNRLVSRSLAVDHGQVARKPVGPSRLSAIWGLSGRDVRMVPARIDVAEGPARRVSRVGAPGTFRSCRDHG